MGMEKYGVEDKDEPKSEDSPKKEKDSPTEKTAENKDDNFKHIVNVEDTEKEAEKKDS